MSALVDTRRPHKPIPIVEREPPASELDTAWRAIDGFPDYLVSDGGKVWSKPRFNAPRGRILMAHRVSKDDPHLRVALYAERSRTYRFVHVLVAAAFIGPCPCGEETRHWNGISSDNRLANLLYGTRSDNMRDRVRHGRDPQASRTHCPSGHPYDEANTLLTQNGRSRRCRACGALRVRARK